MGNRFLFVGERPSPKAERIGASWQNGRLSAKNLWEAIQAAGLSVEEQEFLNLYLGAEPDPALDREREAIALAIIQSHLRAGYVAVGMGAVVCAVLRKAGVPHRQMIHPAARGSIRKSERYRAHVRAVLEGSDGS